MSRLAADIALLQRVATICGKVIYPEPQIGVADKTLEALADEIEAARAHVPEYVLIGDEATFLIKAAQHVNGASLDGDRALAARWSRLGELFLSAIEIDLHNARKSIGEVG